MANATKRPQDVAGTHFFAPANVMKLFEVVKGAQDVARRPSATRDGARPQDRQDQRGGRQCATASSPTAAARPFGTEMMHHARGRRAARAGRQGHGRFRLSDRARSRSATCRASTSATTRASAARRPNPNYRKLPIADRIVEMGRLGQKTGAGWYRYEKGDRTPHPDPEVASASSAEVAQEFGIEQRTFTDEEILRRLLFASVNEACKILEEGKAYRASDIDVMWLHGFGFPRYRGGLMYWADRHRRRRGLPPDRRMAPALRRALEAEPSAARDRRKGASLREAKGSGSQQA